MKKGICAITMVGVVALGLAAIGCPPPPPPPNDVVVPEPVVIHEWKVQSVHHAGWAVYESFLRFAEKVYEMSDGRLRITPFPCGAVVGAFDVFDAVREGVLQAYHSWSSYWVGKDPAFVAFCGMAGGFPEDWQLESWFWKRGGIELARELYAEWDLFFVGPQQYGPESNHFVHRIYTIDCLDGMLFRTPAGMTADLFEKLGAGVVILPGGEIYMALEKGTIEGTEFMPISVMYDMGIHEVAPYFVAHGFHQPTGATEFVVCMEAWEALEPDLQAIVETAVRSWSMDQWFTAVLGNLAARKKMLEFGNTELFYAEECLARVREVAMEVWDMWAAKSPAAAVIIESQKAFLRELGLL
ncbi:hypothetical protein M1N08_01335 [Dehalococcoidia bacterium]|nr:hypothetical protein [Dehalococcoidia bacterium]